MKNFTENTRVQVPAALHLCKLGYTYLDDITLYNPQTNILTDIFIRSVKRLNPGLTDLECSQLLDKIVGVLNNDDLGKVHFIVVHQKRKLSLMCLEKLMLISFRNIHILCCRKIQKNRFSNIGTVSLLKTYPIMKQIKR